MKPTFLPPKPRFDQLGTNMHAPWTSMPQADFDLRYADEGLLIETPTAVLSLATNVGGDMEPVVVKRFRGPEAEQRFAKEADMFSNYARGRHIVALVGAYRTERERYIVTKRLHTTLAKQIAEAGPCSGEVVIAVGRQIAAALDGLHRQQVAHNDISASNIGLDESGMSAWLLDFDQASLGGWAGDDVPALAATIGYALTGQTDSKKMLRKLPKKLTGPIRLGLEGGGGATAGDWFAQIEGLIRTAYAPQKKRGLLYNAALIAILGGCGFGVYWQLRPPPPPPAALACEPIQFIDDRGPPPAEVLAEPVPKIQVSKLKRAREALGTRDKLVGRYERARRRRRQKRKLAAQIAEREKEALRLIGAALNGLPPSEQAQKLLAAVGTQAWRAKAVRKARKAADAALANGDDKAYHLQMKTLYRLDPGDPEAAFARRHGSSIRISKEVDAP